MTQFVFDRFGHLLAEANSSGTAQKEYLWRDDVPVAVVRSESREETFAGASSRGGSAPIAAIQSLT